MSDYSINSISSMRPVETGAGLSPAGASQAEFGAPRTGPPASGDAAAARSVVQRAAAQAASEAAAKIGILAEQKPGKAGAPAELKPTLVEEKPILPMSNGNNVSIHFRVDSKTNAITVFIVDRDSKRVLRSIPPEELNKLQTGDLLEIIA